MDNRIVTGRQPTAEQFKDIGTADFQAVISLSQTTSDNAIPNESELVADRGIADVHLPIDFQNHARANYETFRDIMNVFVHCAMNMRVSAFVFLYQVQHEGTEMETALANLHRLWKPDEVWQRFFDTVLTETK